MRRHPAAALVGRPDQGDPEERRLRASRNRCSRRPCGTAQHASERSPRGRGARDATRRAARYGRRVPTPAAVLAAMLASDPGRPRLTCYDDAPGPTHGERIELSAKVLANWVSKAGNMLQDDLDGAPATTVGLDLPAHWRAFYWALAAWSVGATVVVGNGADTCDVVVTTDHQTAAQVAENAGLPVLVSLPMLSAANLDAPRDVVDEARELPQLRRRVRRLRGPEPRRPGPRRRGRRDVVPRRRRGPARLGPRPPRPRPGRPAPGAPARRSPPGPPTAPSSSSVSPTGTRPEAGPREHHRRRQLSSTRSSGSVFSRTSASVTPGASSRRTSPSSVTSMTARSVMIRCTTPRPVNGSEHSLTIL